MRKYLPSLLDTDTLSELFKNTPAVKKRATEYLFQHHSFYLSQINKYEILKGLKSKQAVKQVAAFEKFCNLNVVLSLTDKAITKAADIYADLKQRGLLITDADILVAAIALAHNLTLVTSNVSHFKRIKELRVENWKS